MVRVGGVFFKPAYQSMPTIRDVSIPVVVAGTDTKVAISIPLATYCFPIVDAHLGAWLEREAGVWSVNSTALTHFVNILRFAVVIGRKGPRTPSDAVPCCQAVYKTATTPTFLDKNDSLLLVLYQTNSRPSMVCPCILAIDRG